MTVSRIPQSVQRGSPPRPSVSRAPDLDDLLVATALLGVRTTVGAVRLASTPARLALRTPFVGLRVQRRLDVMALQGRSARLAVRAQLEELSDGAALADAVKQALDRILAGPLPEIVADSLLEHRVLQRLMAKLLADPEVQEALAKEIKSAVADQGSSLATDVGEGVRARTESLDLVLERKLRGLLRRPRQEPS